MQRKRLTVAITQPYVPHYRVPLLSQVVASLAQNEIDARVFFGGDDEQLGVIRDRGDAAEVEWAEQVDVATLRLRPTPHRLQYRRLPPAWRRPAVLVTEMQATNANAWRAATSKRPFVIWGHGDPVTGSDNSLSLKMENFLNRRADSVLTYTPQGQSTVLAATGRSDGVFSIGNSTDSGATRRLFDEVRPAEVDAFRARHGIDATARVALYLGALNEFKNVPLLADTFRAALALHADCWLLVAGDGPLRPELARLAAETGRVVLLGQVDPVGYVVAARASEIILNPGRIGLMAVDALAMGLPVLTCAGARHAPEVAYLRDGVDLLTVVDDPRALASAWLDPRDQPPRRALDELPSVERAASVMVSAVLRALDDQP